MKVSRALSVLCVLAFGVAFSASLANAGTVTYTCDPSVAAATCTYLNTAIAGHYSSTFTNTNANIYITYGTTGLAETEQYFNFVTYDQYVAAFTSIPSPNSVQVSALSALNTYDAGPYGGGNVNLTVALAAALGLTGDVQNGATGITSSGGACTPGTAGCYNAIITVTNDPGTPLYYDNLGGTEPSDAYDYYATVEHETDEVLGASSCVGTAGINPAGLVTRSIVKGVKNVFHFTNPNGAAGLSDGCGSGVPSAVDLYRYSGAGDLILDSSLSTAPGAYFSYNGGTTNGANGRAGTAKVYNTLANGDDYADFVSSSPDCGTNQAVQDAEGCPGEDAGLTILNDGGGEINILNAVGYSLATTTGGTVVASPTSLTYLNTGVGRKRAMNVRIVNQGTTAVQIESLSISEGCVGSCSDTASSDFILEAGGCVAREGHALKAGTSCQAGIVFNPQTTGPITATLSVTTSASGTPIQVPLSGTGVAVK